MSQSSGTHSSFKATPSHMMSGVTSPAFSSVKEAASELKSQKQKQQANTNLQQILGAKPAALQKTTAPSTKQQTFGRQSQDESQNFTNCSISTENNLPGALPQHSALAARTLESKHPKFMRTMSVEKRLAQQSSGQFTVQKRL